jgi:hypothetical protein
MLMLGTIFDYVNLVRRLAQLGWIKESGAVPSTDETRNVLKQYQAHHGLPVCGSLDGATERHLCACRACRFPDVMEVSSDLQKWPVGMVITWRIETTCPALNRTAAEAAYMQATNEWARVCGVKFEPTTNQKTARLSVRFDGIDGAGRVLAWSDLPDPTGAPRVQKFDGEESWVLTDKPKPGEIDFLRVATHEIGHVLGVGHLSAGNLLQPAYDPNIRSPRAGDIVEVVARYGGAVNPSPTSGSQDGTKRKVIIEIMGDVNDIAVSGYSLVKKSG